MLEASERKNIHDLVFYLKLLLGNNSIFLMWQLFWMIIFHDLTCAISKQLGIQKYKFIVESSWSYMKISKYIISVYKLYIALWNLNKLEILSLPPTNLGFGGAFQLYRKTQKEGEYFAEIE